MKPKPQEKNERATNHPTQRRWHEMNRKQRRETMGEIQSEDLSLEVVHPDAGGIDEPSGHRLQLGGGATEAPYRLAVSARRYCHVVGFVADING